LKWWPDQATRTAFQWIAVNLAIFITLQAHAAQRRFILFMAISVFTAPSIWDQHQMDQDVFHTSTVELPSTTSTPTVDRTKSHNQEVDASVMTAMRDREFFLMVCANTAQHSPTECWATHSIAPHTHVPQDRNCFHQDNASSAHHLLWLEASIAQSNSAALTNTWPQMVSATSAHQDTSRPQIREDANTWLAKETVS
jgi:hypothetical protein